MHGQDLLRLMLNNSRLITLAFPHGVDFHEHAVDGFLTAMGAYWSLASLQSLRRPVFFTSRAAALLLYHLPNLEYLELELEDFHGNWGDALAQTFDALSQVKHLKMLYLQIAVDEWNLNGAWLVKLAKLEKLECLSFLLNPKPRVVVTGAQLAALLAGLSRLDELRLDLGILEVLCSVEEKSAIDTAFARIKEVDIDHLTITIQRTV